MKLPVAVLAGGLATRLRPVTEKIPKALVEVAGEPFVKHQLRLLQKAGVRRVVLCVGYRGEMVQEAVGDGRSLGLNVTYSFDGPVLLGTGGALKKALPLLGDAFLVLYGDSYLPCDYAAAEAAFLGAGRPGLMVIFKNENQWDKSNVIFRDGRVVRYDKRKPTPDMRHIDYGLGALRADVLGDVPVDKPTDLADIYERLAEHGELTGCEVPQRFYEVGSFQGIMDLEGYLVAASAGKTGALDL